MDWRYTLLRGVILRHVACEGFASLDPCGETAIQDYALCLRVALLVDVVRKPSGGAGTATS